jgi:hypothetical protein
MTPLSIHDQIEKDKSKRHIDTWRCRKKATKDYKRW